MKNGNFERFQHGLLAAQNPEFLQHFTESEKASCFFALGQISHKYLRAPKRSALIEELCREFSEYTEFPNSLEVHLEGHYSHKILKDTFGQLGYNLPDWQRHFSSFSIQRIG